MTQNQLQLKGEKTEAMRVGTRQKLFFVSANTRQLGDTTVPPSDSVKSLGVFLDSSWSKENFISQTSKSCYCQLRRISSARMYLSTEASVKLVTSLILSHLDYCNSLISGRPTSSYHSRRRIHNCAARLILKIKGVKLTASLLRFS